MRRRILAAPVAGSLALLLLVTGGCGQSGGGSEVASAGGTATAAPAASGDTAGLSNHDKALKYAQCMREHGIPMEDPEPGGPVRLKVTGGKEKLDAAQQACEQYVPGGEKGQGMDAKAGEQMRKLARCMRENGVENFPDPDGGGIRIDRSVGEDPDFPEAQKKCEKLHAPGGSKETP